jgi:hypothetical protein
VRRELDRDPVPPLWIKNPDTYKIIVQIKNKKINKI